MNNIIIIKKPTTVQHLIASNIYVFKNWLELERVFNLSSKSTQFLHN
jgi:hypothetical protein